MDMTLIHQGLNLMLFGMGVVFVFLSVLVFATTAMSRVVQHYFPEVENTATEPSKAPASQAVSPQMVAIIQAAIDQHRQGMK